MLFAKRFSMAVFSASRTASLLATSPSLAHFLALASAAASSRRTRLHHARCSRHAAMCARLHDGKKLRGEGESAVRGGVGDDRSAVCGGGGRGGVTGGDGEGNSLRGDGRLIGCDGGERGGLDGGKGSGSARAARTAAFLAATSASLALRLCRSSASRTSSRALASAFRCALASSSVNAAASAAS